jgi:hypothetical protein
MVKRVKIPLSSESYVCTKCNMSFASQEELDDHTKK